MVVIEGAGSPAESISESDWSIGCGAVLQLPVLSPRISTAVAFSLHCRNHALLNIRARHIKAFIINKFRGDISLLMLD